MPCSDMMIPLEKVVSIQPHQTVEEAMHILDSKGLRSLPARSYRPPPFGWDPMITYRLTNIRE